MKGIKIMVAQSKQWIKEYGFNALSLALLTIIGGMVLYLVTRTDNRMDDHEKRLKDLEVISYNLGQSCINYNQWQKAHDEDYMDFKNMTQAEFLEIWKMMPRGVVKK